MKNRQKYFAVLVLALVAAVLAGCKKEPSSNNADEIDPTIIYSEKQQWPYTYTGYKTYYEYRIVVDHMGVVHKTYDPHCAFPYSGTCLPEVNVVAERGDKQSDLAILFMDLYKGGKVDLFFKMHDYLRLFPDLEKFPNLVNDIIKGEVTLLERHNRLTSTYYYVGLPKDYQNDYPFGSEELGDIIEKEVLCTFEIRDLR